MREDLGSSAPIRRVGSNQTHSFARLRQVETVIVGVRLYLRACPNSLIRFR
jgi:hypothetical protein